VQRWIVLHGAVARFQTAFTAFSHESKIPEQVAFMGWADGGWIQLQTRTIFVDEKDKLEEQI
jgi:hypothetical protein